MKKWLVLVSTVILAFALGYLFTSLSRSSNINGVRFSWGGTEDSPISMAPTPVSVPALWASSASTIAELAVEADLIIRARVVKEPESRVVSFSGPMVAEDGTVVGEVVDKITFFDTEMEVLDVYKGPAKKIVTVMQTARIEGDPLYLKKEEVILFLVDISDDPIHSQGRALYRIVNPAGRYTIEGSEVLGHAEFSPAVTHPKTVDELVRQIKEAVAQNVTDSKGRK